MSEQIPESVLEWLRETDNQPVRYLTLTHLLGRPESDQEVKDARAECSRYVPTQAILSQYNEYRDDGRGRAY
jgi:hypothetical protein